MIQGMLDRYRCPEVFLDFSLKECLSSDEGYFQFGPNTVCYGQSSSGSRSPRPDATLYDAGADVTIESSRVCLPFNPTDIIDNLRLERYISGETAGLGGLLRDAYYLFRPLMKLSVRKRLQKARLSGWKELSFPKWPVDRTVENICERLLLLSLEAKGIDRIPFVWFWPEGAPGCVMMTHDVETEAGRDFCPSLMDIDDSFRIKASFQVVPEKRYAVSPRFLIDIRSRGFEVAVQDLNHDGLLFVDREEFLRRAPIINRYVKEYGATGFRSAVLYREPEWYEAFEFSFDMSIPNVAHLDPQRGGCCTVFPYFIGDILELPLTTTQDYMLFHLLEERSLELWKTQIELILEKNGLVSFIVHPDYVMQEDTRRVYEGLLRYLQDLRSKTGAWFALPGEIDRWWRARSKMGIVERGRAWQIEGEGADRAVLAYAKKVGEKLAYEVEGLRLPGAA